VIQGPSPLDRGLPQGLLPPGVPSGRTRLILRQFLLLLAVYTFLRATFMVAHQELFRGQPIEGMVDAFLHGLRFDLAAIALSNIPFILLLMAPWSLTARKGFVRTLKGCFVGINTFLIMVMVADLEYFSFTGGRITLDLIHLSSEVGAQADQLLLNHLPLALLTAALGLFLFTTFPRLQGPVRPGSGWLGGGLHRLAILGAVVVVGRGGLQDKVLEPIHAFHSADQELGILTLNSAFTFIKSPLEPELEPLEFFASPAEVARVLRAPHGFHLPWGRRGRSAGAEGGSPGGDGAPTPTTATERGGAGAIRTASSETQPPLPRPNVVVLILESFATEFWGAANGGVGYTPFLDSLVPEGLFFANNFANGRRSIEALPSVLLGVPALMSNPLAKSSYQGNEWVGLGHLLEEEGYHTSFFHGAVRGTMYFDVIARMAGMRDYYPLERYPRERQEADYDGHWGIYDGPFLDFALDQLNGHREPFFTTVFTISTHPPYTLPAEWEAVLPEGELEMHQNVLYVDRMLEEFFQSAREEPWFENTLFVITGDHTQSSRSLDYDTLLGRYMVPLLLYHPGLKLPPVDPGRVTQQVDLLPTILDVVGVDSPGQLPLFGRSVFSPYPGEAVLRSNGSHWLVRKEGVLQRDPDGTERLFDFQRHETVPVEVPEEPHLKEEMSRRLRAHLQHFTNSLISNSFYQLRGVAAARPGEALPGRHARTAGDHHQ